MDAVMTTIDVSCSSSAIRAEQLAWAEERLGPKPGKWNGYEGIADDETRRNLWSKVGYIHGLSAEAGRNIVAIGQTLREMKEMVPHGQFMACVKAEFGWGHSWTNQLMQIAERFSNFQSTGNLPASAQVLALLAAADADDATVEQAAEERWTVAETKRRVAKPREPREPQPTETLALNLIRKGELDRIREALALAERAQVVTPDEVMAEQRLRELGKQRFIAGADADFHRMKDGSWIRLPHATPVVEVAAAQVEPDPIPQPPADTPRVMTMTKAAEALGVSIHTLHARLSPKQFKAKGIYIRSGYKVMKEGRGMVRLTPVD